MLLHSGIADNRDYVNYARDMLRFNHFRALITTASY